MKVVSILSLLFLVSCSTGDFKTVDKNSIKFTEIKETKLTKKEAFLRVVSYLSKTLNDSNYAIKLKNEDTGEVVSQISIPCNEMKKSLDMFDYRIHYLLTVNTKDNKVKVDLEVIALKAIGTTMFESVIAESQVPKIPLCNQKVLNGLYKSLEESSKSQDW